MPGCVITLPKTVSPKTVSKLLDLSFGIFARRGEKYSCYTLEISRLPEIYFSGSLLIRQSAGWVGKPNIPLLFVGLRLRLTQPLYLLNWLIFMFISKIASSEIQHLFVAVFFCYGLYPFGLLGKTGDFEFVNGFN